MKSNSKRSSSKREDTKTLTLHMPERFDDLPRNAQIARLAAALAAPDADAGWAGDFCRVLLNECFRLGRSKTLAVLQGMREPVKFSLPAKKLA